MKYVLTIAGHDLSHGAGITKDLEVFSFLGLHGLSVPSAFVVQGPEGATSVEPVPMGVFSEMIERAKASLPLSGIKVGVLPDAPHVARVAEFLAGQRDVPFVLDPVIAAKNGLRLITEEGIAALADRLLPLGPSLTPNIDEAEILADERIDSIGGMEAAAAALCRKGSKNVILKGGHIPGEPVDLLFDGEVATTYGRKRVERVVHGTGCLFSAALLAHMALDYPVKEAFLETERFLDRFLSETHLPAPGGYYYADPGCSAGRDAEKWAVLQAMNEAAFRLAELDLAELVPAVQMNMGYALREARTTADVAAFPGRIGTRQGKLFFKGPPEFGVSSHVARLCLTYMRHYPHQRAAVDIRYDEALVARAREKGLSLVFWDRKKEPDGVKHTEGRSLDFLVEAALEHAEGPPDIIYDHGDVGKEPIIRLFARDPRELIKKMEMMQWKTN
jgi:hydroxymethylpyrimidine/phosphomethylpyrimidine kinase